MASARRLGRGSQLASRVYRSLPREAQVYTFFTALKHIAILLIKEGKEETEVMVLLQQRVARERVSLRAPANRLPGVLARRSKAPRLVVQRTVLRTKNLFGSRWKKQTRGNSLGEQIVAEFAEQGLEFLERRLPELVGGKLHTAPNLFVSCGI